MGSLDHEWMEGRVAPRAPVRKVECGARGAARPTFRFMERCIELPQWVLPLRAGGEQFNEAGEDFLAILS